MWNRWKFLESSKWKRTKKNEQQIPTHTQHISGFCLCRVSVCNQWFYGGMEHKLTRCFMNKSGFFSALQTTRVRYKAAVHTFFFLVETCTKLIAHFYSMFQSCVFSFVGWLLFNLFFNYVLFSTDLGGIFLRFCSTNVPCFDFSATGLWFAVQVYIYTCAAFDFCL